MKKSLIFITLATFTLVGCGGNGGRLRRDQPQYDAVQEGSASGTSTALVDGQPQQTMPPLATTSTNADTTSAFTLSTTNVAAPGQPAPVGTIAGTMPPPMTGTSSRPLPPPMTSSSRPRPVQKQTEPAPIVETAPQNPPPSATTESTQPAPSTDTAATTSSTTTTEEKKPAEEKKKDESSAPATSTDTQPPPTNT